MNDHWTKEEFEDHWFGKMPGFLGTTVPCDCAEEGCHGWRMKVTHYPTPLYLAQPGDPGVTTIEMPPGAVLHNGDTLEITNTFTL